MIRAMSARSFWRLLAGREESSAAQTLALKYVFELHSFEDVGGGALRILSRLDFREFAGVSAHLFLLTPRKLRAVCQSGSSHDGNRSCRSA